MPCHLYCTLNLHLKFGNLRFVNISDFMTKFLFQLFFIACAGLFTACGKSTKKQNTLSTDFTALDSLTVANSYLGPDSMENEDTADYDYATYFVVVADTGKDYDVLHKKMVRLSRQINLPIDTLGRFYNRTKNEIVLPENDEDEIYAGAYFPRRFPSENLSLEYLNFYQSQAKDKTIALISGIYEIEKHADSALMVLRTTEKNAFVLKTEMFVGCMH
jgi:hypothetical protein